MNRLRALAESVNRDPGRLAPLLAATGVAIAALGVYLNSLANGFAFDDVWIILYNDRVHQLRDLRQILLTPYWPFFGTELGLYRPVPILGYALQWQLGGGAAWLFHAVSILLHACVSVLVLLLLRRFVPVGAAFLGALLFAVHPVHTEAVANIVGQAELIAAILVLTVCLLHTGRQGLAVSWPNRVAYALLFFVALGTKESTVVLPGLLLLLDLAQRRIEFHRAGLLRYLETMVVPVALMCAALCAYLLLRYEALGAQLMGVDANPALPFLREEYRVLNALRAFPSFARLLLFPLVLSADYAPAIILPVEQLTPMAAFGAVLLAAIVVLTLLAPRWPRVGLAAGWFLLTIITVSNLFFPIGVLVAERTLYTPSLAVCLAVAMAWPPLMRRAEPHARRALVALVTALLVLAAARTWTRNPVWDTTMSVFRAVTRDFPESYRGQWALAATNWEIGNLRTAAQLYDLAYMIYPRDSQFLLDYANFFIAIGNHRRALELLEESHRMHPYVPATETVLAYAYVLNERWQEALVAIESAERLGAHRSTSMPIRALAYEGLGRRDQAIGAWRVALNHTRGGSWMFWGFFARTLARAGDPDQALVALDSARSAARADTAALVALDSLAANLRAGCYAPDVPATSCSDPLGRLEGISKPLAKSRRTLQNATTSSLPDSVTTSSPAVQPSQ